MNRLLGFYDMNYKKIYFNIIHNKRNNPLLED